MISFNTYTVKDNGVRTIQEACDEVRRELDVRRKIFDRWVMEGKLSRTDAHDRLERMLSALHWLIELDRIQSKHMAEQMSSAGEAEPEWAIKAKEEVERAIAAQNITPLHGEGESFAQATA